MPVIPLERDQFDLSPQEFCDALALRYQKPMLNLPRNYNGCGANFTVDHALDSRFGGQVTRQHNEVRDAFGDLVSLAWNPVHWEPVVWEASDDGHSALMADLAACGIWKPQCKALFDIQVVDTNASSYRSCAPQDVLQTAEMDKNGNIFKLVMIEEPASPLVVSQWMVYWERN